MPDFRPAMLALLAPGEQILGPAGLPVTVTPAMIAAAPTSTVVAVAPTFAEALATLVVVFDAVPVL